MRRQKITTKQTKKKPPQKSQMITRTQFYYKITQTGVKNKVKII